MAKESSGTQNPPKSVKDAHRDDTEIAEMLMEKSKVKVELDLKDVYDRTSIFHAGRQNNELFLKLLLERGADVNHQTKHNSTVLNISAEDGQEKIVDMLLGKMVGVLL